MTAPNALPAAPVSGISAARSAVLVDAERWFDAGGLFEELARRIAVPTESHEPTRAPVLAA
jgi:hypothetical protein